MELAFVWVEKLRNLENISFNFSKEVVFSYNPGKNEIAQEDNTELNIDSLYGKTISNLTAIVGQNGVGKSTLFHLIRTVSNDIKVTVLTAEERKRISARLSKTTYVSIFKIGSKYYYFKNNIENKIKSSFAELSTKEKPHIENFQCFYYANFFDYSSNYSFNQTFDLSTTGLVKETYAEIKYKTIENEEHIYNADFFEIYKTNEIFSQIQFVADFDKHIPFNLPTVLSIRLKLEDHPTEEDEPDEEDVDIEDVDKKYYKVIKLMKRIATKYNAELPENHSDTELRKYIKNKFQQAAVINFLREHVYYQTNVIGDYNINFDITEHYTLTSIANTKNLDKLFIDLIDMIPFGEYYSGDLLLKWIEKLIELINIRKHYDATQDIITINLNEINKAKFLKLISSLTNMQFYPSFLEFYWDGISSGENALVTIFSRFYKYTKRFNIPNSSLLLIFDECEINFHPAWQRKLIHFLTTIFPQIFNNSKLQFFVSSHSPLILSDIPKSNIIFLQKNDINEISISHLTDKKQTFAANIHTLLSDAFFMDEGTIGEVAKTKINWLIDIIGKRYTDFEKHLPNIEELIEIIGEPVIKSKLVDMINEKHSLNLYNINERIKVLEKTKIK